MQRDQDAIQVLAGRQVLDNLLGVLPKAVGKDNDWLVQAVEKLDDFCKSWRDGRLTTGDADHLDMRADIAQDGLALLRGDMKVCTRKNIATASAVRIASGGDLKGINVWY